MIPVLLPVKIGENQPKVTKFLIPPPKKVDMDPPPPANASLEATVSTDMKGEENETRVD